MDFVVVMLLLVAVVIALGYGAAVMYNRSRERREA